MSVRAGALGEVSPLQTNAADARPSITPHDINKMLSYTLYTSHGEAAAAYEVLNLLALLVQKYEY
jgi:hypothetical protein